MHYCITYNDMAGVPQIFGLYETLRKAQNAVKRMLRDEQGRKVFGNVTIWHGVPGGMRIETHNVKQW